MFGNKKKYVVITRLGQYKLDNTKPSGTDLRKALKILSAISPCSIDDVADAGKWRHDTAKQLVRQLIKRNYATWTNSANAFSRTDTEK